MVEEARGGGQNHSDSWSGLARAPAAVRVRASETLLMDERAIPDQVTVPAGQLADAKGLVTADVATRDYRLVLQSKQLIVYNPYFNGTLSKGAYGEIQCAILHRIPVHILQEPAHDPNQEASSLKGDAGALGGVVPGHQFITLHSSLDQLLGSIS